MTDRLAQFLATDPLDRPGRLAKLVQAMLEETREMPHAPPAPCDPAPGEASRAAAEEGPP